MNWQAAVERTVNGLGYEFVACERAPRGLLRVTIDRIPGQAYGDAEAEGQPPGEFITVDDCEKVTRQLQYVLEVEGVDYARLEVSSPGLDRPLRKAADYQRFAGQEVELTLRLALQGRKKFRGLLQAEGDAWRLVLRDGKQEQALDFSLDEVREARLVPVLNFKGRAANAPVKGDAAAGTVDGGRKQ